MKSSDRKVLLQIISTDHNPYYETETAVKDIKSKTNQKHWIIEQMKAKCQQVLHNMFVCMSES